MCADSLETLSQSPFVTLIKLIASSPESELYAGIKELLVDIVRDQDMFQVQTAPDALDALVASLSASCGQSTLVLDFLDDCCARFSKGPIKYFDDLDALRAKLPFSEPTAGAFSPILLTLVEQWPFKGGKPEKGNPAEPLAQWLSKLLYLLKLIGEDEPLLTLVRDALVDAADAPYKDVLGDSFLWKMGKEKVKAALKLATGADFSSASGSARSSTSPAPLPSPPTTATAAAPPPPLPPIDLEIPPPLDPKHTGLTRWRKKDPLDALADGDIAALLVLLSSPHPEIRIQARTATLHLAASISPSTIPPPSPVLLQTWVLLNQVLETAALLPPSTPLPHPITLFASHALAVLPSPLHPAYPKLSALLTSRPNFFPPASLPRKLVASFLLAPPSDADPQAHHQEAAWLLAYLLDALRTPADMEVFRVANVFEKVLSYYSSGSCSVANREVIVKLLIRAATGEVGGSTTLVTRVGVVSWAGEMLDRGDRRGKMLRVLVGRVWEGCDKERVRNWSAGTMEGVVRGIVEGGRGREGE